MMRYNLSSQNRAVTVKDYKAKLLDIPQDTAALSKSDVFGGKQQDRTFVTGNRFKRQTGQCSS